jgi:hypothetical protein
MIVYTADLHLSPTIWQDMPTLAGDAYAALAFIVNFCVKNKVTALVIGGDLFDKERPDSRSVTVFMHLMNAMAEAEIPVYVTQGQHERADPPWARLHEHVQYVGDGEMFSILEEETGVNITVRAYDNASAVDMEKAMKPLGKRKKKGGDMAPDILVVHQLVRQLVPFEGSWDFDLDWVPEQTALVLGGDYHKHCHEDKLWYPGSTHMRDTSQIGDHYFLSVEPVLGAERTSKGKKKKKKKKTAKAAPVWNGAFSVIPHKIPGRGVISCLINDDAHIEPALAAIADYDAKAGNDLDFPPLVYLKYNPEVDGALSRVEGVCQEKSYFLRTKPTVGGTETTEDAPALGSVTLEECMSQAVDREKDPEFFSFAMSLLTNDPRTVFSDTKEKLGITKE